MTVWFVKEFIGESATNHLLLISKDQKKFGVKINNLLEPFGLFITPIIKEGEHCGWQICQNKKKF